MWLSVVVHSTQLVLDLIGPSVSLSLVADLYLFCDDQLFIRCFIYIPFAVLPFGYVSSFRQMVSTPLCGQFASFSFVQLCVFLWCKLTVLDFVSIYEERASSGKTTYVHCKAGRGRSTTIVLCYLVCITL